MIPLLFATMLLADVNPPDIVHEPLKSAPRLQELVIEAEIVDDAEVFEPTVQLRLIGDAKYTPFRMETKDHLKFRAIVPGGKVEGDFEYYVEAFDTNGNGPARSGSPSRPHRVSVVDALPPPAMLDAIAAPSPEQKPSEPTKVAAPTEPRAVPPEAVAPAAPGKPLPIAQAATLGVGVVAAAVGAVLWFGAAGDVQAIDRKYDKGMGLLPEDATAWRAAQGQARLGSALAIGGGAVAAGGLVWLLLPAPGGGGSVGLSGRF